MANDCSVRQYKKVVNNSSLPVFEEFDFTIVSGGGQISVKMTGVGKVVMVNGATTDTHVSEVDYDPSDNVKTFSVEAIDNTKPIDIKVTSKYKLVQVYTTAGVIKMNINGLKNSPLTLVQLNGENGLTNPDIVGDISAFSGKDISEFKMINCPSLTGNIISFASFVSCINLSIASCAGLVGDITQLVAAMAQNRTSGTMYTNMKFILGIKFNGQYVGGNALSVVFSATGATVSIAGGALLGTYTKATNTWEYPS